MTRFHRHPDQIKIISALNRHCHPDQTKIVSAQIGIVILSEAKDMLFVGRNPTSASLPFFKLSHNPRLYSSHSHVCAITDTNSHAVAQCLLITIGKLCPSPETASKSAPVL